MFFSRPVLSNVQPGYLGDLLPKEPPQTGESWRDILQDVDRIIMPGITHWHSPNFHGYYPSGQSYPSVVGELMSAGLGVVGLSWVSSRQLNLKIMTEKKMKLKKK